MVADVRRVLEVMRAKTKAIAAKVKAQPVFEEPAVISFRIRVHLTQPQREPMRQNAYRDCAYYKRGGQKPLYKETRRGRGRCITV